MQVAPNLSTERLTRSGLGQHLFETRQAHAHVVHRRTEGEPHPVGVGRRATPKPARVDVEELARNRHDLAIQGAPEEARGVIEGLWQSVEDWCYWNQPLKRSVLGASDRFEKWKEP